MASTFWDSRRSTVWLAVSVVASPLSPGMPWMGLPRTPPAALISWTARSKPANSVGRGRPANPLRQDRADHECAVTGPCLRRAPAGHRRRRGARLDEGRAELSIRLSSPNVSTPKLACRRLTCAGELQGPDWPS